MNTHLQVKVEARNAVHRQALQALPGMIEALQPFIGKKIINQGNTLAEKVKAALPRERFMYWGFTCYHSTLWADFRVTATDGRGHTIYAECSTCVGELENHVLKSTPAKLPELRTDYTPSEVIQARHELEKAEQLVRLAEAKILHFGRYDQ